MTLVEVELNIFLCLSKTKLFSFLFLIVLVLADNAKTKEKCIDDSHKYIIDENKNIPQKSPDDSTLRSFDVEMNGKMSNIKYHISPPMEMPLKGTIVFLCGGPGFQCPRRPLNFPWNYEIITIDYLGIGENSSYSKPEQMSIDNQANIVSSLLSHLNRSNLILYGHSFGTTVATAVGSKHKDVTNKKTSTTIKGIVLEGVAGPAKEDVYGIEFINSARIAWNLLSSREQKKFLSEYNSLTKKFSFSQKEQLDRTLTGKLVLSPKAAAEALKEFSNNPKDWTPSKNLPKWTNEMNSAYRQIKASGCQTIGSIAILSSQKIFGGKVTPVLSIPSNMCDCPTLDDKWNPNNYKITNIPIVYINGDLDPATPLSGAKSHYEGQDLASEKVFIVVPGGGHAESSNPNGKISSCLPNIFDNLSLGSLNDIKKNLEKIQKIGCENTITPTSSSSKSVY